MKAAWIDGLRQRPPAPWTVQANVLLAACAVLAGWLLTFHPITAGIWGFFLFYLAMTAAFVIARSALLRFLMTGFHVATGGVGTAALLLVPDALSGDPLIPVRGGLVIACSIAVTVLQWLPATSRWLDRA